MENPLFLAKVVSVNTKLVKDTAGNIIQEAGTIDVLPIAHHMGSRSVRPLSMAAVSIYGQSVGFNWVPSVGTWVVCGCLEDYPDHLVCLGALYHPQYVGMPVMDGTPLQLQDCVLQHETGTFFRFRNLDTVDSKGNQVSPSKTIRGRSEFIVEHVNGDTIEMIEPVKGQTKISIKHHSGASAMIDVNGNVILTPASGKEVKLGSSTSSHRIVMDSFEPVYNGHGHLTPMGPIQGVSTGMMTDAQLSTKSLTE